VVFPGTAVSSPNKTDCHDITEILLKVALNTINHNHLSLQHILFQNQGLTPLSTEIRVTINVRDTNNEEPQFEGLDPTLANSFRGSVPENRNPRGRDRMVVRFTTTCAISAYHH
jgi:hypothetical protein